MHYLDAVADPTRLRIARRLAEGGPATLTELADAAEVHPNTARSHLSALADAGVVTLESEHLPRGRPRTRYALAPGWTPFGRGFQSLAELLAAALSRRGTTREELHDLGVEWGRYLLGRPGARDAKRELPRALESLGFQARVVGRELRLSGCPCPIVAPEHPELVCRLAAAVLDGVVNGPQRALELAAQRRDARVDAARGGGVAEYAPAVPGLGGLGDGGEQAVDLRGVHERRALR
jgi:predicted ArsR family transcriptional regulator